MKFDTIGFLDYFGISYTTQNSIVTDRYVGLFCPYCNDHAKPYLGINKTTGHVQCWRCGSHSLLDTIMILTNISSKSEGMGILNKFRGESSSYQIYTEEERKTRPTTIDVPGKPVITPSIRKYLIGRGYNPKYLYGKFQLRSTTYENPSYRIIIPILYKNRIVSWTSRDYTGEQEIRYISCPKDKEIIEHKTLLYNLDNNKKGGNVLLTEGILDAVRTGGVASFGLSVTSKQLLHLIGYKTVFIMFDGSEDAIKKAYDTAAIVSSLGIDCEVIELEEGEDPDTAFREEKELIYLKKELNLP